MSPTVHSSSFDPESLCYLVGCYTGTEAGDSRGIYGLPALPDDASAEVRPIGLAEAEQPSFLMAAPSPDPATDATLVYAVSESGDPRHSAVTVWTLYDLKEAAATGRPAVPRGRHGLRGLGACHVACHGKVLATANYGSGSSDVIELGPEGLPKRTLAEIRHEGHGPDATRQEAPHIHWAGFVAPSPGAPPLLFLTDLGTDTLTAYAVDPAADPTRAVRRVHTVSLPGGSGPRHLAVASTPRSSSSVASNSDVHTPHRNAPAGVRDLYLITELSLGLYRLELSAEHLVLREHYTLLPGEARHPSRLAAAVTLRPDGRELLTTVRGLNRAVLFRRDPETGTLSDRLDLPLLDDEPRDAAYTPDGRAFVVASQAGGRVRIYRRSPEGRGYVPGGYAAVKAASSVRPLDV